MSLFRRFRSGDEPTYWRVSKYLHAVLRRLNCHPDAIEDMIGLAILRILEDPEDSILADLPSRVALCRIASNLRYRLIDLIRRERKSSVLGDDDQTVLSRESGPDELSEVNDFVSFVQRQVAKDPKLMDVYPYMREETPSVEIAKHLGLSVRTVDRRRKEIKRIVEEAK